MCVSLIPGEVELILYFEGHFRVISSGNSLLPILPFIFHCGCSLCILDNNLSSKMCGYLSLSGGPIVLTIHWIIHFFFQLIWNATFIMSLVVCMHLIPLFCSTDLFSVPAPIFEHSNYFCHKVTFLSERENSPSLLLSFSKTVFIFLCIFFFHVNL